MKVKQDDGTEIEVFTPDEVTAREKAAADAAVKTAVAAKEAELTKLQEELKGLTDKDHNFAQLRKQKEDVEAKLAEITKNTDTKIKEVESKIVNKELENAIKDRAAGDAEMEKKIKFHFDHLNYPSGTPEEIEQK